MNKIEWLVDDYLSIGNHLIPCVQNLKNGYNQGAGIKYNSKQKLVLKRILWPLYKTHNDLLVDGFIEKIIGKLIKQYIDEDSVFLEIGCGDMSLRRFLPDHIWYNAFDLELSGFHIRRVMGAGSKINIAVASADKIPVKSNSVSLIVSTETFEHIPEIDETMEEIYRISKPGSILICSIPNNFCYKYDKKGPNRGHINNWTYDGFVKFMKSHYFEYIEGFMKGKWMGIPSWITNTSYHFPFSSKLEYHNTNFFYVFRVKK